MNSNNPIAVVGLGALFPGSETPEGFWRTIVSGRDCLTDVPASHWRLADYYDADGSKPGKTYARRGAFLGPVSFEPLEHGMPPNVVPSTDTAQLLALMVARQVLENGASARFAHVDRDRIGVILGVASATELVSTMSGSLQRPVLSQALREEGFASEEIDAICGRLDRSYVEWTESTFPGLLGNVVAGRIANRFDLGGANCVVDAACASSLGAVRMAMQELWSGDADLVLTGGVDAINDIFMYMCFSKTLAMSRTGDCRPFAANADGTMLGEGIGMFALRRLADAERDGDPIYAVLRGIGASSDGRAKSIYAPRPVGQAKALRRAYESAGYAPETVGMVEAHGTGTPAGDAAEVEALREVFGAARQTCALGSIKSQIGHTKSAAGAASLYKTVMALHHKVLPATLKVKDPNPALKLDESPFYLNTELRPWIRNGHPRRAGVSAFGFGGSNFHLTLEEYTGAGKRPLRIRTLNSELFLVSGATDAEARNKVQALVRDAAKPGKFSPAARESQKAFSASDRVRFAFVARDASDLAEKAKTLPPSAPPVSGRVAFLFPGQGSQFVGMGAALAMAFDPAIQVWDAASALSPRLARAVFPPPVFEPAARERQSAALTATETAQPALGVTEWMYLELLRAAGLQPDFCAGHSFGEVTALLAAGALSPTDFLAVAKERGSLMAAAASEHQGAMLAVIASAREVEPLLPEGVTLANINSPRQVVLAGPGDRIAEAASKLSGMGYTVVQLPVATAFHSHVVASAAEPFTAFLQGIAFAEPKVPVFSNTTAAAYPADLGETRTLLGGQLAEPVRFADQIEALYQAGARVFIEVGPGNVLSSLTSACLEGRPHLAVPLGAKGSDAVTALWNGLAQLAIAGIPFDTEFAWREYEEPAELPAPSPLAISLCGTNFGKKFPRPEEAPVIRKREQPVIAVQAAPDNHVTAVQQIQQQMADSHAAVQKALSESHLAYLRATEAAFGHLNGNPLPAIPAPVAIAAPVVVAPLPPPIAKPAAPPPAVKPTEDLTAFLLGIVAEKTGYPRDILTLDMDLEADLGIDSIKRVQILASVREARPDLPDVDAKQMGSLRTLGAILEFLGSSPKPTAKPTAKTPEDLTAFLLGIVAEKTGYPRDILTLDMDLEADLGIDSIKRVQILASVREARPDLPDVDAKQMGSLRTLGAILNHLGAKPATALPAWLSKNGLVRLALREVEASPGTKTPLPAGVSINVVGNSQPLRDSVARSLRSKGMTVFANGSASSTSHGTVFVSASGGPATLIDEAKRAFDAARQFGGDGFFITVSEPGSPLRRGLEALARTVALENPGAIARAICTDPTTLHGDLLAEEILHGTCLTEVTLSPAGRTIFEEVSLPVGTAFDTSLLQGNPVIVVSGGARGVTAQCLLGLAEVAPIRLALLGRSPLEDIPAALAGASTEAELKAAILAEARARGEAIVPKEIAARAHRTMASREIHATLNRLRELGSQALYLACDVTDPAAVHHAFDEIRNAWGKIDGLIHGAGVVADKRIADKTPEQFERVFTTKVTGLRNLLDAVQEDPLRLLMIFSSVAGRYGNAGQVDYAMANATMCQIAADEAARRGSACLVRALGWGPWDGGMVTPDLRAHFAERGVPVIPMDRGVAAFVQELCHRSDNPADIDVVIAGHAR
jgi:acyl transferase domain-containing protein/NAD(P)-dependent dehydrogenase (short-subunit alcohol dehydrogenase family)/acyl carrier protein